MGVDELGCVSINNRRPIVDLEVHFAEIVVCRVLMPAD